MSALRPIPKLQGGDPAVVRWAAQLVDTLNAALRGLPSGTRPLAPDGTAQGGSLYQGTGVPKNALGSNGDFYFRTDTPGSVNQRLYVRAAGVWTGIL